MNKARLVAVAAALWAVASLGWAQSAWPTRPLRVIVPYAPGGTSDAAARLLAERLQPALGHAVVVESRVGASGTTGIDAMAKATDGHAIAFSAISPLTLNPHLQHVPYDPMKDVVPVASVMYSPVYFVATPAFGGKGFADAPTFNVLGYPEANLSSASGISAPVRTPPEALKRLDAEISKLLGDKDLQDRLARLDNIVSPGSTEQFTAQVQREHEANARVVKEAGIKVE